jgi:hypothetical protein
VSLTTTTQLDRARGVLLATAAGTPSVQWRLMLHGWPGLQARDLVTLATTIATGRTHE